MHSSITSIIQKFLIYCGVITIVGLLPQILLAATVESVSGLPNGKIEVNYASGSTSIYRVFSTTSPDVTLVTKLSNKRLVALQSNGRKLAWINTDDSSDIEIERLNLVTDKRYQSAYLGVHNFGDGKLPVVVAKRNDTVDTMLIDRIDGELEIIDRLRINNTSIRPAKTTVKVARRLIQLRSASGAIKERLTVAGTEDLRLLQQHAPVTCTNQWYETHAHSEGLDTLESYVTQLNAHDVGCSLLFVGIEWENINETYNETRAIVENNPGRFVPFYNADPNTIEEVSVENLDVILQSDSEAVFRGIGEFAFYRTPLAGTSLTSQPWPDIFTWAADHNLIIMIHLNQNQGAELDTMLDAYPNTTVLLHGIELATSGDLPTLLSEHSNLYFSLDTANMIRENNTPAMFPDFEGDEDPVAAKVRAADFIELYDANNATMVEDSVNTFAATIAAAPERVLWGTDVAYPWHMRSGVYQRLIDFSNDFADVAITETEQADYFTNNAYELLGDGVTID